MLSGLYVESVKFAETPRGAIEPQHFAARQSPSYMDQNTMSMNTLADAFYDKLRDIYSAEKQLRQDATQNVQKSELQRFATGF